MRVELVFQLFMLGLQALHFQLGILHFHIGVLYPDPYLCIPGEDQFNRYQGQGIDDYDKKNRTQYRGSKGLAGRLVGKYLVKSGITDEDGQGKGDQVAGQIKRQPSGNFPFRGYKNNKNKKIDYPANAVGKRKKDRLSDDPPLRLAMPVSQEKDESNG
jgi:hypothetical protein